MKEDRRTIFRFWLDKEDSSLSRISVQTPDFYMSFCTMPSLTKKERFLLLGKMSSNKTDYQFDYKEAGDRAPDVTICLYSLDVDDMENCYGRSYYNQKNRVGNWRHVGINLVVGIKPEAANYSLKLFDDPQKRPVAPCIALALTLLRAGGAEKLVSSLEKPDTKYVLPLPCADELLRMFLQVKLAELKKFEDTKDYHFSEETSLELLQEAYSPKAVKCTIM